MGLPEVLGLVTGGDKWGVFPNGRRFVQFVGLFTRFYWRLEVEAAGLEPATR